jgi:hypothetical protein
MEITNIEAFDRAFGKHVHDCPWESRIDDLQDFNSADSNERIYRAENEDAETFLKNIAKKAKDEIKLPIVGYFRDPDVPVNMEDFKPIIAQLKNKLTYDVWDIATTYTQGDIKKVDDIAYKSQQNTNIGHNPVGDDGTWWKVYNTLKQFNVEYQNHTASVTILIVGHGRASVDEVVFPLSRYLQKSRVINIPYRMFIDETNQIAAKFNFPALIKEPDMISFGDVTVKKDKITQVYGKSATYEINLPMLYGDMVAPVVTEIEFMPIIAV